MTRLILILLLLNLPTASTVAAEVTPLLNKSLPEFASQEGVMLTVEYQPGEQSAPHRHNAHTFVYVLEGSVIMQVEGQEAVVLKPGDTFYESPTDVHQVSRNASSTETAKFLVFFIKSEGSPASLPVTD